MEEKNEEIEDFDLILEETANVKSESNLITNVEPVIYDASKENLANINYKIRKLNREELVSMLKKLNLGTNGKNDVLRKRLKSFYKEEKLVQKKFSKSHEKQCSYKYLCVIDFEATCDEQSNDGSYPHEIIEFPAVLIETSSKTIISEFHEYCRPVLNKTLTEFCTSLTGITQEIVDEAATFSEVLEKFMRWKSSYKLGCGNSFAIVTDGPWDMNKFLIMQCSMSQISFPDFGKKWINVRKTFANCYKTKKHSLNSMLRLLEMEFEGKKHCGLDDARNIARIVIRLLEDGAKITVNERLWWNCMSAKVISESGGFGEASEK